MYSIAILADLYFPTKINIIILMTNKNAVISNFGSGVDWQGHKSGMILLLHITKPFSNGYVNNVTSNIKYYVPDEAVNAFKEAWDSRFVIKGHSEYTGKIYGK